MAEEDRFFVDTDVLINHLRQNTSPSLFDKACAAFGVPAVSDFVVFELEVGARRMGRLLEFHTRFSPIQIYPVSQAVLLRAAEIQATLLKQNQVIGLPDTFIAATAIVHGLPLFTLNVEHFQRVDGLRLLSISS